MAKYRVLRPLASGLKPGEIVDGSRFKELAVLVKRHCLARVQSPPLEVVPGWTRRSEISAELGVATVEEFLDANSAKVAERFNVQPRTVARWKDELEDTLSAREEAGCKGC